MEEAGVLLHQFDKLEDPKTPWLACQEFCYGGSRCWCAHIRDRISALTVSAKSPPDDERIPIFSRASGGYILDPTKAPVLCTYAADGGSMSLTCGSGEGGYADCIPGCSNWCDLDAIAAGNGVGKCSYRPEDLKPMIEEQIALDRNYNEIIIDAYAWAAVLPDGIQAFFYVDGSDPDEPRGEKYTRVARNLYLEHYGLEPSRVPLLHLNLRDWHTPFEVAAES